MNSIQAHAKVNIFLKITGHKDGYHTLISRFVRVEDLYDTITFVPWECDTFTIEGCDGVPREENTIYKAYRALNLHLGNLDVIDFFLHHKVVVAKCIPAQAGLGGGSSDAGAFLRLVRQVCDLNLDDSQLSNIGATIGADVPFFVHNYPSANVSGFGEIVEPFEEAPLQLELYTPPVGCNTAEVYRSFKAHFLADIKLSSFIGWDRISSREILERIKNPRELNDLYAAALVQYPELEHYAKSGWYFSGSGSTFFRVTL